MKKSSVCLLMAAAGLFLLSGCAALVVGGAAAGAGAGTYLYANGELTADYRDSFEKVWEACVRTVAAMKGTAVAPSKDISKGTIEAVIDGEKCRFSISYKAKDVTSVAIRVGLVGNKIASQRLHDKVGENLVKN
jgi:hypothetical protein